MKILVIGQGAREHAIIHQLHKENVNHKLFCWPGNPGIAKKAELIIGNYNDFSYVKTILQIHHFNLVIIGPENPLALGLADFIQSLGVPVFGPSMKAAQLESSKIYAKQFMKSANIPTAKFWIVNSTEEGIHFAENLPGPYVLKQDGLCAGKGVTIHEDLLSLELKLNEHFKKSKNPILLEEFLIGNELSYLVLVNNHQFQSLPISQDYKRKFDHNVGPNTGGMGAIAPIQINFDLEESIVENLVKPTINQLKRNQISYQGVLYFGVICTVSGPMLIEYNARFGDPEAQAVLPLLDGNWSEVFLKVALQKELEHLKWKNMHVAVVNAVTKDYAENENFGLYLTEGFMHFESDSSYLLCASIEEKNKQIFAKTGRVASGVGISDSLSKALDLAYSSLKNIKWHGKFFRTDIGYTNKPLNSLQNNKEILL